MLLLLQLLARLLQGCQHKFNKFEALQVSIVCKVVESYGHGLEVALHFPHPHLLCSTERRCGVNYHPWGTP